PDGRRLSSAGAQARAKPPRLGLERPVGPRVPALPRNPAAGPTATTARGASPGGRPGGRRGMAHGSTCAGLGGFGNDAAVVPFSQSPVPHRTHRTDIPGSKTPAKIHPQLSDPKRHPPDMG